MGLVLESAFHNVSACFRGKPEALLHLTTACTKGTARRLKMLCFSSTDECNDHSWTNPNLLLQDARGLSEDSEFSPQTHNLKLRRVVIPLETFSHLLKQLNLTHKN